MRRQVNQGHELAAIQNPHPPTFGRRPRFYMYIYPLSLTFCEFSARRFSGFFLDPHPRNDPPFVFIGCQKNFIMLRKRID